MKTQSLYDIVENIVSVVFYKHFGYILDNQLKQDLFQEGYLKAYDLLNSGNYDPSMPLRNYLYTGVRNAMTNYLYHCKKELHSNLDELDKYENVVGIYDVDDYDIDIEHIKMLCDEFKRYGDYYMLVVSYLSSLGLIKLGDKNIEIDSNNQFLNSLITITIWEIYEMEENR